MGAEISSAMPELVLSSTNAAFGVLSRAVVAVIQFDTPPETEVVQATGSEGAFTLSKFSVKTLVGMPRTKLNERFPRLLEPSESRSVATRFEPQRPLAVKVNARLTVPPPPVRTP